MKSRALVTLFFVAWSLLITMGAVSSLVIRMLNVRGIEAHSAFDHPVIECLFALALATLTWTAALLISKN